MIKNYFKIAITDLRKNTYFSILNISGLALGISLCMVIITVIKNQLDYDSFHPHSKNIYRVNTEAIRKNGNLEDYATSPFPLGNYLKNNYSFVQDVVSLTGGLSGEANINEKTILINGFFTDNSFFNVFGYSLLYGDKNSALAKPNAILLTHKTSEKLYGNNINPIGQTLAIKGMQDFVVTGVLDDPPGKTHLEFDAIGSNQVLEALEKNNTIFPIKNDWANYYSNYTYVLLKDNSALPSLQKSIDVIGKTRYMGSERESTDKGYRLYTQAINKIISGPALFNNMGKALPQDALWYLSLVGLVVILSAGFNYNSLSLARALTRAKEIGVRKSLGAKRSQLIIQFLIQSIVTGLIAMLAASFLFHFLLRPFFENIEIFKNAGIVLYEDAALYILFTVFSLVVGLVAGIFPALYLSSFNPLKALNNPINFTTSPKLGFRKVLLTVQFSIALLFVVGLVNIYRQIDHVMHADYGFKKDNIINVDLQGNDYAAALQVFSQVSGVASISASSHSLGTTQDRAVDVRVNNTDDKTRTRDFTIDGNFLDNFNLHLIAGKSFTKDLTSRNETSIIVNEAFLQSFRLGNAMQSLGTKIILGDSINVMISGIVKDFNFQPLTKAIAPVLFRYDTKDIAQLNIALNKGDIHNTLIRLAAAWKKFDNANSFKYSFLTDELQKAYSQYSSLPELLATVAILSIMVAALGLLGLATFTLKQRVKEISVRKILGATVLEIGLLLSKSFFRLIIAGVILGLPVAIYLDNLFLKNFVYKINPVWGYLLAMAFLLVIVFLSIGIQIIKTATINPVKILRTE